MRTFVSGCHMNRLCFTGTYDYFLGSCVRRNRQCPARGRWLEGNGTNKGMTGYLWKCPSSLDFGWRSMSGSGIAKQSVTVLCYCRAQL